MKPILTVALLLLMSASANAADYYVNIVTGNDATGNGSLAMPWKNVTKCDSAMPAGNTCNVAAGRYDQRSTATKNNVTYLGAAGAIIASFNITGRTGVTIQGFEITNSGMVAITTGVSITATSSVNSRVISNNIHDTADRAIRCNPNGSAARCQGLVVRGNTMARIGPAWPIAPGRSNIIECSCDDSLFENNDMSHGEDFNRVFGNRNVFRNNLFHASDESETRNANQHIDAVQSFCSQNTVESLSANYLLMENNQHYDNLGANNHFFLINGTNTANCPGAIKIAGSTEVISRQNMLFKIGSSNFVADTNNAGPTSYHKYYNNTTVTHTGGTMHDAVAINAVDGGTILNNIFYDAITNSTPRSLYALKSGASPPTTGRYNLGFITGFAGTWSSPYSTETGAIRNMDPLFIANTGTYATSNFALQSGSPAKQAANELTTVATGGACSGSTVTLNDAHFFQDGWSATLRANGVLPDEIAIGAYTNTAAISSINYSTNVVTLATPLTCNDGDAVQLYKDSSGNVRLYGSSPDMGAFQTNWSPITPPTPGNNGIITTSSVGPTSLTLSWTKATDTMDPQSALEYEVCQSTTNNVTSVAQCEAATIIRSFVADIATFGPTGLSPLTTYWWNVVVKNTNGDKVAYATVNATTTCGASKVVFTDQPSSALLGASLGTVQVSVENSANTVCTDSTATITLSKNGSATWGTLTSGSSLSKSAVAGVATWTDLSVTTTPGAGSIDANSSGLTVGTSNSITITATCTPHHVSFISQPSSAVLGSSLGTVSVGVYDSGNVLCGSATNSVVLSKNGSATWGTLVSSSSLTKSAVSGVATWTDLSVTTTTGSGSINAASSGLTGAISNSITISSSCTPDHLTFISQPASAVLNASLGTVTVGVYNSSNLLCSDATNSVTLSKNGSATWGTLVSGSSLTKSAVAGVATWTDLSVSTTTGAGSIDAASGVLTGTTSNSITISSSCTPHHLTYISQPVSATLGSLMGTVSVGVYNSGNALCSDATNSVVLSKNPSATWGTLTSGSSLTKSAVAGVATWTDLSVTITPGSGSIDAASTGLTGATSNSITISSPCTPNHISFISQPSSALLNASLGTVTVGVYNSSNALCTSATNSVVLSKNTSATWGTLVSGTSLTKNAVAGIATWTDLAVTTTAGSGSIDASSSGLTGDTSDSITITATCTPDHVTFISQPSSAALNATLGTVTVGVYSSTNVLCSGATNSVTLSKNSSATWGTLTSGTSLTKSAVAGIATWTDLSVTTTAGAGSINAAASGLTGDVSSSITITSTCTPDHLTFISQPSSTTIGSSLGTVVVGVYNSSNVLCTSATNTVTLSKNGSATWGTLVSGTSLSKVASSGLATWVDLSVIDSTGSGSINADASGLTGSVSNSITISDIPVANESSAGWCQKGGIVVVTGGQSSSTTVQGSYPSCSVTVYVSGTLTSAAIYSDTTGTALANPFTATATGRWQFYAAPGTYDVALSGGTPSPGITPALTLTAIVIGGITPTVYASLPSCSSDLEGYSRTVTNSNTTTWGSAVAGGGSNHVLAYCNGTSWTVRGK